MLLYFLLFPAIIIGYYTKKILYLGVRNKCCTICSRAQDRNTLFKKNSYRNWNSNTSAMEADQMLSWKDLKKAWKRMV